MLDGGWLAGLPPFGAAVGAGFGGIITTRMCLRLGRRHGLRLLPLISLPAAGILLLCTVWSPNPYLAVAGMSACFAAIELNEAAYWAAAMNVGGDDSMAVTGILNTGGNLGGVVATPIVGYLSGLLPLERNVLRRCGLCRCGRIRLAVHRRSTTLKSRGRPRVS